MQPRLEDFITVRKAAELFPGSPHINTVRRWMYEGKLRSWKYEGTRVTTREAILKFVTSEPADSAAHLEAEAELDSLGV